MDQFLGHPLPYWIELQRRLVDAVPAGPELLVEIVALRGKLAFYESRISEMVAVMERGK